MVTVWRLEGKGVDKAWSEVSEPKIALSGAGALSGMILVGGETNTASS